MNILAWGVALAAGGACLALAGCNGQEPAPTHGPAAPKGRDETATARAGMVEEQIEARGIRDAALLAALRKVPRHEFVPAAWRAQAYEDHPLPIGEDQTISQPYIVAEMTAALHLSPGEKVLEIGTGSGYQAAVLAELGARVFTIEIVPALAQKAAADLKRLGYGHVSTRCGDGFRGWPEAAPFDAVIVTCAPDRIPPALLEQLRVGGRLVIPRGEVLQDLILARKTEHGIEEENLGAVRFVPMTGEAKKKN